MTFMLQQNSSEIYVNKMMFLVSFFTITFLKRQHLRAHIFLESVSSCIAFGHNFTSRAILRSSSATALKHLLQYILQDDL